MILATRAAGDLAQGGKRMDFLDPTEKVPDLREFGIKFDLAAHGGSGRRSSRAASGTTPP